MSVPNRAARSVPWTVGTYVGTRGLNVITTLGLTRLLSPDDFGTVAMATIVVLAVSLLRDSGLGQALIVRPGATDHDTGVVFTLTLLTSIVAGGAMVASAPLIAKGLADPRLEAVLVVMAVSVVVGGPATFFDVLLQRDLLFKRRFVAQMAQATAFAVVAVGLALNGAGIWALVLGQLASVVANTVALVLLVPRLVRPQFRRSTAREMFRTGRGFLVQAFTSIIQQNVDYLIVGRVLGTASVGYYYLAFRLAELPFMAVSDPVSRVTFPAISRMRAAQEDTRPLFLRSAWAVAYVATPLGVLLSALAEPFVSTFLGASWGPMVGVLTVLGLWGAVRPVQNQYAWYYNSLGYAGLIGRLLTVALCVLIPALYLTARHSGLEAVAGAILAQVCLMLGLFVFFAIRLLEIPLRRQLKTFGPVGIAAAIAWFAAHTAGGLPDAPMLGLGLGLAAGAGAYLAVGFALDRKSFARLIAIAARTTDRRPTAADS